VQFSNSLAGGRYCIIIANHLHLVLFLAYEHPRHKCKCQLMKVYALLSLFALNFTVKMPSLPSLTLQKKLCKMYVVYVIGSYMLNYWVVATAFMMFRTFRKKVTLL